MAQQSIPFLMARVAKLEKAAEQAKENELLSAKSGPDQKFYRSFKGNSGQNGGESREALLNRTLSLDEIAALKDLRHAIQTMGPENDDRREAVDALEVFARAIKYKQPMRSKGAIVAYTQEEQAMLSKKKLYVGAVAVR